MTIRIGVDLGGTKIEVRAIDTDGNSTVTKRQQTPRENYPATVEAIVSLVDFARAACGDIGAPIGVGIPGTVDPKTGLVKNANSTWLIGKPLGTDLAAALGRPPIIANDANCFALSEANGGAGSGFGTVFGVILGTGVGGGIVVNGNLIEGANGIAGEWGHTPMPNWPGAEDQVQCYCGRTGCIEGHLSGPALATRYHAVANKELAGPDIVRLAAAGERIAVDLIDDYFDRLSAALALIVNTLDPDVIVFGGGLSNLPNIETEVAGRLIPHIFAAGSPPQLNTGLRTAQFGDASGARGAALLCRAGESQN